MTRPPAGLRPRHSKLQPIPSLVERSPIPMEQPKLPQPLLLGCSPDHWGVARSPEKLAGASADTRQRNGVFPS
jgi:hypothetical protein